MIAFEFDRTKIRRWLAVQALIFAGSVALLALFAGWAVSCLPTGRWMETAVQGTVLAAEMLVVYAVCVISFSRKLRQRGPALVVNHSGIIDNASGYDLGQLAWTEIETIYPCDWTIRLFGSQSPKMPVVRNLRIVLVVLKDSIDFQPHVREKSWIVRSSVKEQLKQKRKLQLFIPERLLDTHADELVEASERVLCNAGANRANGKRVAVQ